MNSRCWLDITAEVTRTHQCPSSPKERRQHAPLELSLKKISYSHAPKIVAGMLVSAASAAYVPPDALVPQIVIAARRPPTSRAAFAASAVGEKPHIAAALFVRTLSVAMPRNGEQEAGNALGEADDPRPGLRGDQHVGGVQARPDDHRQYRVRGELVQQDACEIRPGQRVQREDPAGAVGRELDRLEEVLGFEGFVGQGDEVLPLDVDEETGDVAADDLGDDVSEGFERGEAFEEDEADADAGVEVAARGSAAHGDREEDAEGVRESDLEDGCGASV